MYVYICTYVYCGGNLIADHMYVYICTYVYCGGNLIADHMYVYICTYVHISHLVLIHHMYFQCYLISNPLCCCNCIWVQSWYTLNLSLFQGDRNMDDKVDILEQQVRSEVWNMRFGDV